MRGRLRVGVGLGVLLGSLLTVGVEAQGPFSAQIQRAINALLAGSYSFTGAVKLSGGSVSAPSLAFASAPTTGIFTHGSNTIDFTSAGVAVADMSASVGLVLKSTLPLSWSSGDPSVSAADLSLFRDGAANTLAQRNGTNPQIFHLYTTFTDASNYEMLSLETNGGANAVIGYRNLGTGVARGLEIRGQITAAGWLFNTSNNIVDLGSHTLTAGGQISGANYTFASTGGQLFWPSQSVLANISNGVTQFTNFAGTGFTRLILGTNDATANGFSLVNTSGDLEVKTGDASARAGIRVGTVTASSTGAFAGGVSGGSTSQFTVDATGTLTKYKNVTTAGWGVPAIVAAGRSVAQTAAVASVATYTVGAADGSFEVSANVLVTTATSHSFTVTVAYTDEGNTARTTTLNFSTVAGVISNAAITNAGGAVPYEGVPLHIRAKAATAITVATTGTFTTVTYNVEGSIRQIS